MSQTKVELEFNEIRALAISDTEFQLVYTDSKEYTCNLRTRVWDITVHNLDNNLINPGIYTCTPQFLGTSREAEHQAYYERIRNDSDLILATNYWASVDSTAVPSLTSRASTPLSEYQRSRDLDQHASPTEISRYCFCGIDVCHCDIYVPGTPPTPPYIFLWKPKESPQPIEGLHWNRYTG